MHVRNAVYWVLAGVALPVVLSLFGSTDALSSPGWKWLLTPYATHAVAVFAGVCATLAIQDLWAALRPAATHRPVEPATEEPAEAPPADVRAQAETLALDSREMMRAIRDAQRSRNFGGLATRYGIVRRRFRAARMDAPQTPVEPAQWEPVLMYLADIEPLMADARLDEARERARDIVNAIHGA